MLQNPNVQIMAKKLQPYIDRFRLKGEAEE